MTRYFFDMRDGEAFSEDDEGMEYPDIEHAQMEAVASLADMAKDLSGKVPNSLGHPLAVEVRDIHGLLFVVGFRFARNWVH
jgi:hypothetical protein